MASITKESNGRKTIQFVGTDNKRRSIRLGKVSQRVAEAVKMRVEHLLAAKVTGHPLDADTARWVAELPDDLEDKLVRVGLITARAVQPEAPLGPFLTAYIDGRADLKPAKKVVRSQVIRDLTDYFGDTRDTRSIGPSGADDFKQWLIGRGLASITIQERLQVTPLIL